MEESRYGRTRTCHCTRFDTSPYRLTGEAGEDGRGLTADHRFVGHMCSARRLIP